MIDVKSEFEKLSYLPFKQTEFSLIENPPSKYRDICAFLLLEKLVANPKPFKMVSAAEHDQIYLDVSIERLSEVASEKDIWYLYCCGIFYDSQFGCLSMFP